MHEDPELVASMRWEYRSLVTSWAAASASAEHANAVFDSVHLLYKRLRQTREGRAAIAGLITDPDAAVRLMAATHSLAWDPVSSETVLSALAESEGLHSLSAKWTLESFHRGTLNLDW